mgnify:FL=1
MYRCPFMPCMNCPYYAEQAPNIPPTTEIPNSNPIQGVEQMNNNMNEN